MEYRICFPTPPDQLDPENDNLDVCVRTDDGREYTFLVTTPENLKALMAKEGTGYLHPGAPFLVAETLTEDVITRLIGAVMDDDMLPRIYGSDI